VWLDAAEREPLRSFRPNGFVVTALQAAHGAIWQTPVPDDRPRRHLELALQAAVSVGDDTDTVAAIAGALLGARWGAAAVPGHWRRLVHGWPGLTADDLVTLAERLAAAPQPGSRRSPSEQ
jgi:ADP-ribosylglycohydrolase